MKHGLSFTMNLQKPILVVFLLAGIAAADGPRRPAVLAVTRPPAEGWESGAHWRLIAKPLVEAGFEVDVCQEDDLAATLASGRYNALVYAPMVVAAADATERAIYRRVFPGVRKAIGEFLAKGGGVFIMAPCDQVFLLAGRELTGPWGARMLVEEIKDPPREKEYFVKWLYTTRVAGPAAAGVRGVWYPASGGKWTWPLEVDENWTVVLQSEKTATPQFAPWDVEVDKHRRTSPAVDGVPLAAVRRLGPGRIAVMGVPHTYSFMAPFDFPGAEAFLAAGIDGTPSDGRRLIFNLLAWLSAPSLEAGLGGATTPPRVLRPFSRATLSEPPPVRWNAGFSPPRKTVRGLAGARTTLSSGLSTVAEYAQAARRSGLGFLVFLEDHKLMTPEKNARLRRECKVASDAAFCAVPGFTIEDEFGAHWFWAGDAATYPNDIYLSADKRVLAGNYGRGPARAKTLAAALCDMMFHQYLAGVRTGSWNHRNNPYPALDFRDYSAMAAAATAEDGRPLDDSREEFAAVQNIGANLQPWAIELMSSASQVADRAARGYAMCVRADSPAAAAAFVGSHAATDAMDQYISNGPAIVDFQAANVNYPALINDKFRPDLFRMQVFLDVRSEAGLREVRVQDGPRLVRRFLPAGMKEFRRAIDLFNIPQQNLALLATDMKGRHALSKPLVVRCTEFQEIMCSDRNNQMFNGFGVRDDGSVFREGPPTGNGATPDKGTAVWLISPCFPYAYDFRTPCCPWDGGRYGSGYAMRLSPVVSVEGAPEKPYHNTPRRVLHSQDVMIGRGKVADAFPEKYRDHLGLVWNTLYPVEPTRFLELEMRLTYWRTRPDGFTATFYDGKIRFKNDVVLTGNTPIVVGAMGCGADNCNYEIRDSAGRLFTGKSKEVRTPLVGRLDDKGSVAYINKMCTSAMFSLTPGLCYEVSSGYVRFYLAPQNPRIAAGTEFPVKILAVGSPLDGPRDVVSRADAAFGITGGRPAYRLSLDSGRLLSQRYTLALDGGGIGAAGSVEKTALPAYLPVAVAGLNPNWTTVYLDHISSKWRPAGVAEGTAYVELDPASARQSFFIGHPVTCDRNELFIQFVQTGPAQWQVELHNPTDKELSTNVAFAAAFTPCAGKPARATVPAGDSVILRLP